MLSKAQKELVVTHVAFAGHKAKQWSRKMRGYGWSYDDCFSLAEYSLVKAANLFDTSRAEKKYHGKLFRSYVGRAIDNSFLQELRGKSKTELSLGDLMITDKEGDEFLPHNLQKQLTCKNPDKLIFEELAKKVKELSERQRFVLSRSLAGQTQKEIGKSLNITQPQISRDIRKARKILKEVI